jgi:hypothetical protein
MVWLSVLLNAALDPWPLVFEYRVQVIVNPFALTIAIVNEMGLPPHTNSFHQRPRSLVEVVKKSWDRLPACHFPRISDRLEAYPTQ